MPYRYVPLLRSKAGEIAALQNLTAQSRGLLFPLVHVSEKPPVTFAARAAQAWAALPMAVDGLFNFDHTGSATSFTTIFNSLGQAGVPVIPSTEYGAPPQYVAAVTPLVGQFAPGLVVKVNPKQLPGAAAWVAAHGWPADQVDLVINAGEVGGYDPDLFADFISGVLSAGIPQPSPWRSVTLAASAAPKDHGNLPRGRSVVARADWHIWRRTGPRMHFQLDYGDYGIAHPDLTEPPGEAMASATVSVRYTAADHWIVIKGYRITGANGVPMTQQYIGHANALAAEPEFGQIANCWGDQHIQQILAGAAKPGNRRTWVGILLNRHLSHVADRLP